MYTGIRLTTAIHRRLYAGYISNDRKPEQLLYLMFVFYFKFSRAQFMRQVYARL